ncbi:MAG: hypothetical protein IH845_05325 [Nanoarchaeota archaeon]|nr:hypothetical protein [Nanoarchaeota archaeon]
MKEKTLEEKQREIIENAVDDYVNLSKEKTLSDEIQFFLFTKPDEEMIPVKKIKQAIKRLKERLAFRFYKDNPSITVAIIEEFDKEFGDKLT